MEAMESVGARPRDRFFGVELALVVIAIALRLMCAARFKYDWGYDYWGHLDVLQHAGLGGMPPVSKYFMAYNPPLYYLLAGAIWKWSGYGASTEAVRVVSLAAGALRILLVWWAARQWLTSPLGRAVAIALAGFLPASLHLDLMVSNESLNATLGTAALITAGLLLSTEKPSPTLTALVGAVFGLTLLTKISVLVALVLLGGSGVVLLATRTWRRTGIAALLAVALAFAIALPAHLVRREKDMPVFATMFTAFAAARGEVAPLQKIPVWERRPLRYFGFTGTTELIAHPYWPTMAKTEPRFFPLLAVTLWVDYYYFSLSGAPPPPKDAATYANGRPVSATVLRWAQISAVDALIYAAFAIPFWLACVWRLWRARDPRLAIALVPGAALAAALSFCLSYPIDRWGAVKGTYLLFAWLPAYLSYGVGVAWLWARPRWRVLAVVALIPIVVALRYDLTMWF